MLTFITELVFTVNNAVHYFQSKGANFFEAKAHAIGLLNAQVVKQTSMLSYLDAFFFLGGLFVITMPLLLFVRTKKRLAANVVIPDISYTAWQAVSWWASVPKYRENTLVRHMNLA